jgi:cell division protein FtsI (penicillin-binding protein 3)
MGQIILEIGKENIVKYLKKLKLLDPLAIELAERSRPLFPNYANLTDLSLTTISYGYGISESPAHFIQAMIPIVNGGILYPLTLVKQKKVPIGERVFKKSTSRDLKKLLRLVVAEGTGRKADIDGYFIGGKTGTANIAYKGKYDKEKRISSFIGLMPAHKPQYLSYIIFYEPVGIKETYGFAGGGWTAAPTTQNVFKRIISLLGLQKTSSNSKEVQDLHIEYKIRNET